MTKSSYLPSTLSQHKYVEALVILAIIKIFLSFEPNFMGCPREKNLREGGGGAWAG